MPKFYFLLSELDLLYAICLPDNKRILFKSYNQPPLLRFVWAVIAKIPIDAQQLKQVFITELPVAMHGVAHFMMS